MPLLSGLETPFSEEILAKHSPLLEGCPKGGVSKTDISTDFYGSFCYKIIKSLISKSASIL